VNDIAIKGYITFFEEQRRQVAKLGRWRLMIAVAIAIILLAILSFLNSPVRVWVLAAVLYAVAFHGLHRLRRAMLVTSSALEDFEKVARRLNGDPRPNRQELVNWVKSQIKPDDSNVPEALASFADSQQSGEGVKVVANSAFAQPSSELSFAQFYRTALVLGGLFGTVLFFAIELGGPALLQGDLPSLLPGLRGALASTLAGILGSVSIGFLSSSIEQVLERATWEAESLIGGPFLQTLAVASSDREILNEAQLWQSLLGEVRQLREDTNVSYAKLAIDVGSHTIALQALSTQLTELPAVQVPPQLARLQDVVADFKAGVELLDRSASTLVNAVGAIGVYAPSKTLEEFAALKVSLQQVKNTAERNLAANATLMGNVSRDVSAGVERTTRAVEEIGLMMGHHSVRLDAIDERASLIDTSLHSTQRGVEAANVALGSVLAKVDDIMTVRTANGVPRAQSGEGTPSQTMYPLAKTDSDPSNLGEINNAISQVQSALKDQSGQLSNCTDAVKSLGGSVESRAKELSQQIESMSKYQESLNAISRRLVTVQAWHERAQRAPMMRLLTLPLWVSTTKRVTDGS